MKPEDLFLAIGGVEESRLARSELTVQSSSEDSRLEEYDVKKKNVRPGRIIRNLLIAAVIVSMLAVTAFAVSGFLIFDNPTEMLTALFGDQTGYDHSEGSITHDPNGSPEGIVVEPTFDRVPADETLVKEELEPLVEAVGQSISWQGYTLTVDAHMYDAVTGCGLLTYTLENPDGIKTYELQRDGEIWFPGGELVRTNQWTYNYIVEEKTTDTRLTVACYYKLSDEDFFELTFTQWAAVSREELSQVMEEEIEQLKQEMSPEEAVELVQQRLAQQMQGTENAGETEPAAALSQEEWVEAAYYALAAEKLDERYTCPNTITFPISTSGEMSSITLGSGAATVSAIAMHLDAGKIPAFPDSDIFTARIRFKDGTEYVVDSEYTMNYVFAMNTTDDKGLTYMFNRVIDVNQIEAVILNEGTELTVD